MLKCEYCGTEFSVKSSLVNHQKSAKYCLQAQGVESVMSAKCSFCQKVYATSHNLAEHVRSCPMKRIKEVETYYQNLLFQQTAQMEEEKTHLQNLLLQQTAQMEEARMHSQNLQLRIVELEEKLKVQELDFQRKYYEAILHEKDVRIERSEKERDKVLDDLTDMARQTKTKTTNTHTNIMINNCTLDLQDTGMIRSILERHMDINVLALGQKGVARMLRDTLLMDENGQKRYRCTDANRGNFEFTAPSGNVERDPKAAKLTHALVKSEIRDLAYDRGDKFWKNQDGSTDMRKFDTMSEKVQEVAELQQDDTKFRSELSVLMS